MKGYDAFSVRHINNFIQFFGTIYVTFFVAPRDADFIFAFVVKCSFIITLNMRAFSVMP